MEHRPITHLLITLRAELTALLITLQGVVIPHQLKPIPALQTILLLMAILHQVLLIPILHQVIPLPDIIILPLVQVGLLHTNIHHQV